jgi:hypothetical protein
VFIQLLKFDRIELVHICMRSQSSYTTDVYTDQTRSRVLGDDSMVSIVLKNLQLFSQTHNIIVIWVNTLCKTLYLD